MINTINQSFSEVYDILMHLEQGLIERIPKSFLNMIYTNRDTRI